MNICQYNTHYLPLHTQKRKQFHLCYLSNQREDLSSYLLTFPSPFQVLLVLFNQFLLFLFYSRQSPLSLSLLIYIDNLSQFFMIYLSCLLYHSSIDYLSSRPSHSHLLLSLFSFTRFSFFLSLLLPLYPPPPSLLVLLVSIQQQQQRLLSCRGSNQRFCSRKLHRTQGCHFHRLANLQGF